MIATFAKYGPVLDEITVRRLLTYTAERNSRGGTQPQIAAISLSNWVKVALRYTVLPEESPIRACGGRLGWLSANKFYDRNG